MSGGHVVALLSERLGPPLLDIERPFGIMQARRRE
jgi:hypothetical protein